MNIPTPEKTEKTLKDLVRELDRLKESRFVALAVKEQEVRNELETRIAYLHNLEQRGKEIVGRGVDTELIEQFIPVWGC